MRFFIVSVVLSLLILCSCQKPKSLTEVLKSDCFWDITNDDDVIGGLNMCYQFLPNGKCYIYYYNFKYKKRTDSVYRYSDTHMVVPDTWSTIGDSVLIARGIRYRILAFTQDSFTTIQFPKDTVVIKKNCKTFIEK